MLDFLLSPFKAIYNLNTYIKATKQSVWKTLLFLVYFLVLFSVLFYTVIAIKTPPLRPFLEEMTEKVAQVTPDIVVKDGRLSANNDEYYEIIPEDLLPNVNNEYVPQGFNQKIVFDTARTEPVYPTLLEQENIGMLITDKAVYAISNGRMEMREFVFDKNQEETINSQYIRENKDKIVDFMEKLFSIIFAISVPVVIFVSMITFMLLAIVAVAISQLFVRANVSFGDVCSICCYLLSPVFLLLFISLILPYNIPLFGVICFIILVIYAQFILNKIKFNKKTDEE